MNKMSLVLMFYIVLRWSFIGPDPGCFKVYHKENILGSWQEVGQVTYPRMWFDLKAARLKSGFMCVSAVSPDGRESDKSSVVFYIKALGQWR